MSTQISKHFDIRELVPKSVFITFGEQSQWFVRPELIQVLEFVRTWFNAPITINNWHTTGTFQYRCFRPCSYNEGGTYSQHRLGCAADINIKGFTPQQIYNEILANEPQFVQAGLTTMENMVGTPTWNHLDIRFWGDNKIHIVDP